MGVDLRQRFTLDPNGPPRRTHELLFVGRLVEKKGLEWLLTALPDILRVYPKVHLTVAGGGPLERRLHQLVEKHGIEHCVDFLGPVKQDELPALYRRATLLVAPFQVASTGDQEGFPLVPLEAIGCGCPLVCGQVAAFGEIIRHDQEAMLVTPNDHQALADGISALLADPQRRERLASQARARCLEATTVA